LPRSFHSSSFMGTSKAWQRVRQPADRTLVLNNQLSAKTKPQGPRLLR